MSELVIALCSAVLALTGVALLANLFSGTFVLRSAYIRILTTRVLTRTTHISTGTVFLARSASGLLNRLRLLHLHLFKLVEPIADMHRNIEQRKGRLLTSGQSM